MLMLGATPGVPIQAKIRGKKVQAIEGSVTERNNHTIGVSAKRMEGIGEGGE